MTRMGVSITRISTQSSTYQAGTSNEYLYLASNAVDGNLDGSEFGGSINHTLNIGDVWWQVDLGNIYQLGQIKVYNRNDGEAAANRLAGAKVYVGETNSGNLGDYQYIGDLSNSTQVQEFGLNFSARFVKIIHTNQFIHLGEVEVFGTDVSGGGSGQWAETSNGITYSGHVGIGTGAQSGYELAVDGKIHTKQVKIDSIGWTDYVFESNYKLPTLEEVQKHITEKGHLINIPSAKEVEVNGIELGEMNRLLLEKIEELTLYILEQEKRIKNLEKQ